MTLSFNKKCYSLLKEVPRGKVTTYAAIARILKTKAYRAVGNAMHNNPFPIKIPCHRVVKNNGEVGGFSSGIRNKIRLLKKEGIEIKKGKIDLSKYGYSFI